MDREQLLFVGHGWIEVLDSSEKPCTPRKFRAVRPECSDFTLSPHGVPYRIALELMLMLGYEPVTPRSRRRVLYPQTRYFENPRMPQYLTPASFQVHEVEGEYFVDLEVLFQVVLSIRIDGFFNPS
jgi:hypothetical protein